MRVIKMMSMVGRLKDLRVRKDINGDPILSDEKYREFLKQGYKPDSKVSVEVDSETYEMYI